MAQRCSGLEQFLIYPKYNSIDTKSSLPYSMLRVEKSQCNCFCQHPRCLPRQSSRFHDPALHDRDKL